MLFDESESFNFHDYHGSRVAIFRHIWGEVAPRHNLVSFPSSSVCINMEGVRWKGGPGYVDLLSLCSLWNNSAMMLKNGEWNGMMSKNCGGTGNGATVEHER